MTKENQKLPDIELTPYMETDDKGIECMKFKFVYDNKIKR